MVKGGYIYIITNKSNTVLYIGVTADLTKRIWEHQEKIIPGFSSKYNLDKLIYYEQYGNIEEAIAREKYLKGKKREFKVGLVNKVNREWRDLCHSSLPSS